MAASSHCPASVPHKATVCVEPVTGNDRGRLGSSLGLKPGSEKPTARGKKKKKSEEGTIRVLGEQAEPRGQEKEKQERPGTKLRPGTVLLLQHKLGWT